MFLNPPFGRLGTSRQRGQVELWVEKLVAEYQEGNVSEAILLVNAMTYKRWFDPLWEYPLCFVSKRLSFYNERGEGGRSPHGSVFAYLGGRPYRFRETFSRFGPIVYRM